MDSLRRSYHFPDSNGFVSMFVVEALAEVIELSEETNVMKLLETPQIASMLNQAVKAIASHRDLNAPISKVSSMAFWNQRWDGELEAWRSWPENIAIPFTSIQSGTANIMDALAKLGFSRKVTDGVKGAVGAAVQTFLDVFNIPGDADDTGCNLAMGMTLIESKKDFLAPIARSWISLNSPQEKNLFGAFVQYAYRPFQKGGDDARSLIIDPRTYFWLHDFLTLRLKQNRTDLALITTWLSHNHSQMPFGTNNVDASVVANALYGMTKVMALMTTTSGGGGGGGGLFQGTVLDEKFQLLFESSIDLLAWILESDRLKERPDLMLLYYPSTLNFYMMTGRLVHELYTSNFNLTMLDGARDRLGPAMRKFGTQQLLNLSIETADHVYWTDGILASKEDSVFATSAALNALLDTWTLDDHVFDADTPDRVKTLIGKGLQWLKKFGLRFAHENVFFSGSEKSFPHGFPPLYPANYFEELETGALVNGSQICRNATLNEAGKFRIGVSGYFTGFEERIGQGGREETCFGHTVPFEFPGYAKCKECYFPYWSAPSVTRSFWLLALAKGIKSRK